MVLALGVAIAIALMLGGAAIAMRYIITQIAMLPERPEFANENTAPLSTQQAQAQVSAAPPQPAPLEPGAYRARVTQPIGLVLRSGPGRNYRRLGGVEYNARLIVLGESQDGRWQQVRLGDNGPEGWVIDGNTQPVE